MAAKFLEARGIETVPESERHGKPYSLLSLWFISNAQLVVIAYGAAVVGLGLSLPSALAAIAVGTILGTPVMAYHSAQGPKLGLPQMIQSRAQFGLIGAALPTLIAFVMYVVFAILGSTLLGPATGSLLHVSADAGIIVFNVAALLVTWVGYRLIHDYGKIMALVTLVLFAVLLIKLITEFATTRVVYHATSDTAGTFVLGVAISATNQITWAPYVSDYSRYLPKNTPVAKAFWFTAAGAGLGAFFSEVIGALAGFLALDAVSGNAAGYLSGIFHGGSVILLLVLILGALPGQIESLYGGFLTALTAISPSGKLGNTAVLRVVVTTAVTAVATVVAIAAHSDVLAFLTSMSEVLLYLLIPWTAINLADFYFVRKGDYDLDGFFHSRTYGAVNWPTVIVYLVSFGIELPFVNASFFTGPLARFLGGADISWLVGFVVGGALYTAVSRRAARLLAAAALPMGTSSILSLGDLALASGETLPDAELAYRTYGTLSPERDNAVLVFTYYTGTDRSYAPWIGAGRPLDPDRLFVVVVNHFGGGVSSSPSTGLSPFPAVAVRDNVSAARRLLDELGIGRVRLAAGWSLGGMQALELAVQEPRRCDAILAVCSAARCGPMNAVFLGSVASTLRGCAGDNGGALDAFGRVYAGWAYSEEYFADEVFREFGAGSADEVLESWGRDHQAFDAGDLLASLRTWRTADVGAGRGGLEAALRRVSARTILMPSSTDRYFTLSENRLEASLLPHAELSVIDSPLGHIAGRPGIRAREQRAVDAALRELLNA